MRSRLIYFDDKREGLIGVVKNGRIQIRQIAVLVLMLLSINLNGQKLSDCGIDDDAKLTRIESEFLNEYMNEIQRKGFDFIGKRVIFITGNTGRIMGSKSEYFKNIKKWNRNGSEIATWTVELNEEEKIDSGGYDVIVTYWVKYFPKNRKRKIISKLRASR